MKFAVMKFALGENSLYFFFSKSQPFTKAHKREVGPNRLWSTN